MFLYVYTGQITFAAIGSQGTSKEAQSGHSGGEPKQDREGFGVPPPGFIAVEPCPPKAIYCLANKVCLSPLTPSEKWRYQWPFSQVGLTRLRDIAFEDIRSKLDEDNIVEEFFSPFTAE
jgi:hypothetical protein